MHFHLLANSHLDPVWLWDWREGLNEGITTCRTVLALMDEFPELSYLRGESSVYAHIAEHDPKTFRKIRGMIASGRWDVVGGTLCQPDTNLPTTEVLCRHFTHGLDYFRRNLGVRPTAAWAADSFGHSAGWPEIYAAAGMKYFAFSRPFETDCTLPCPAFWWQSPGGRRVLCWRIPVGWYGSDRGEVAARLDAYRAQAAQWGVQNIAVFFGLGDHGGGPTRRQLNEILRWRENNRDITTSFSTLHGFFAALEKESAELPVVTKELNFTLRGCYASAARFKFAYRKTENRLLAAERTAAAINAHCSQPANNQDEAWQSLLFNTFHDILPGTSIERAYEDQFAWLGVASHHARCREHAALNRLCETLDTRVPASPPDHPTAVPVVIWNPHPRPFAGHVEFEACLDYRPITSFRGRPEALPVTVRDHRGRALPFQEVAVENNFAPQLPWRKRVVLPLTVPALGWQVVRIAWEQDAPPTPPPRDPVSVVGDQTISNGAFTITARRGNAGIAIKLNGRSLFGRAGLQAVVFDDPYGSWGDHDREGGGDDISRQLATMKVLQVKVIERGPHRAALWIRMGALRSEMDLTFFLEAGSPNVRVESRTLWNQKAARLKLVMAGGDRAEFEVPGGSIKRVPCGEVPGGRWVRISGHGRPWLFASDALYNFDTKAGALRATVVRSARYATSASSRPSDRPWQPYLDLGEHRFQFILSSEVSDPWTAASLLEQPVQAVPTHPHAGGPASGSLLSLSNNLHLLGLKNAINGRGWIMRAQVTAPTPVSLQAVWLGKQLSLGRGLPGQILSWRLTRKGHTWRADLVNTAEESIS